MTENDTDDTQDDEPFAETPADDEPVASADDATHSTDSTTDSTNSAGQKVVRSLQWAAFAILLLVALIATLRFYFAASNAINEFVTRRYRPLFQAIFNLVILLASALGLSVLVRRIA